MNEIPATRKEQAAWEAFKKQTKLTEIPIPYLVTIAAVNIAGVFYLRDPIDNSSTDGVCAGAVNGIYHLDKNKTEVKLYDPTGNLLRVELELNFGEGRLRGRACNRRFDGSWRCSDWITLASW